MNKMFRRFLATGMAAVVLTMPMSAKAATERFKDVQPGSWYYTAVDYAASEGLFSGTSPTTFSPKGTFTRGMIVKVLGDMDGIDISDYPGSRFADVKPGSWYAPYVEWAVENGIAGSVDGSKFAPSGEVTREQMAQIFYNYAEYAGCDLSTHGGLLENFSDGGMVSKSARYAMMWALTHGVLNGSGDKLYPQGTATRAQVAQIFYNCRELFSTTNTPQTPEPQPTPSPGDVPRIEISDSVRAKLQPNQDPEKILEYMLLGKQDDPTYSFDGTSAVWDPSLQDSPDAGRKCLGSWLDAEHENRSSAAIANGFTMKLTRTASTRFYITAEESDGAFCLYYAPSDALDSAKMSEIKSRLNLPSHIKFDRSLCFEGAGWAGPMPWEQYHGAQGIADKIEYYLTDLRQAIQYYITEPEPGVFYLLYGE